MAPSDTGSSLALLHIKYLYKSFKEVHKYILYVQLRIITTGYFSLDYE